MDETAAASLAVVQRHMAAMQTRDPATVAADYAEDTVVITTLADGPVHGRAGIEAWVREELPALLEVLDGEPDVRMEALGEYVHLVVTLGPGRFGTETYHVRNDEIVFESATFFLGDSDRGAA